MSLTCTSIPPFTLANWTPNPLPHFPVTCLMPPNLQNLLIRPAMLYDQKTTTPTLQYWKLNDLKVWSSGKLFLYGQSGEIGCYKVNIWPENDWIMYVNEWGVLYM
jgi:hypothetical protein